MPELKPAYLIFGDDEARLDAWRARLRARVQEEAPAATLEVLREEAATAEATVGAFSSLTLSVGRRYVLVDGIERWKEAGTKQVAAALGDLPPETVVVLISSGKPPATLVKAVEKAGGQVQECAAPNARAYPRWAVEQARELGFELDREAAEALVQRMPHEERPRRLRQKYLMRELEKLSTYAGNGVVTMEEVDALTVPALEARVYELADALIEEDAARALGIAEELRTHGEEMMHILFGLLRQLQNAYVAWAMVNSGKSLGDVQSALRVPQFVARRLVSQARQVDGERLERALDLLADLDWTIRGGDGRDPESALTLMVARAAA